MKNDNEFDLSKCHPIQTLIYNIQWNINCSEMLWIVLGFLLAFFITNTFIPSAAVFFAKIGRTGIDFNKTNKPRIPESLGIVAGVSYLSVLFLLIPFLHFSLNSQAFSSLNINSVFLQFGSGALTICCMLLLGFADDIFDLRWRFKLIFPLFSAIPLVAAYSITGGATSIKIPTPLKSILASSVDLKYFYHLYMFLLCVFSTNAVNIYSGINGLEVGQSIIVAFSLLIHNFIQIFIIKRDSSIESQLVSIYFLSPFLGASMSLFAYNRFPATVFVGDSFCYFAGIVFSCSAILGHYGKTLILFFMPQIVNFSLSFLQLIGVLPCPRHRMPKYSPHFEKLTPSTFHIKMSNSKISHLLFLLKRIKLIYCLKIEQNKHGNNSIYHFSNMTLPNLILCWFGNLKENQLFYFLMFIQVLSSVLGFTVRYFVSHWLY